MTLPGLGLLLGATVNLRESGLGSWVAEEGEA
jgi:hypothetical protein